MTIVRTLLRNAPNRDGDCVAGEASRSEFGCGDHAKRAGMVGDLNIGDGVCADVQKYTFTSPKVLSWVHPVPL